MIAGVKPVEIEGDQARAVQAWNLMGGEIVWPSINDISEYLEVEDIELFIDGLVVLLEHSRAVNQQ